MGGGTTEETTMGDGTRVEISEEFLEVVVEVTIVTGDGAKADKVDVNDGKGV